MDEETDLGPVTKKEFVDILEKTLTEAKKKGAKPRVYGVEYKKAFFSDQLLSLQPAPTWKYVILKSSDLLRS